MGTDMKIYAERSVTLTRVIKAPRELVWKAWTDTEMLKQWWGPEQFTNPVVQGDVKVGGVMHITMHGPKGSRRKQSEYAIALGEKQKLRYQYGLLEKQFRRFLDIAKKYGSRFLHCSTSECYGDPLEHPQTETYWGNVNPIGPRSVYDESKRFAEDRELRKRLMEAEARSEREI